MMGLPLIPDSIRAEAQNIWHIPIPGLKAGVNKLFDKRQKKTTDFLPLIRIGIIFLAFHTHQNKTALQFYLQDGLLKLEDNAYGGLSIPLFYLLGTISMITVRL